MRGTACMAQELQQSCYARPFEILSPDGVDPDSLRMLAKTTDKARFSELWERKEKAKVTTEVPSSNYASSFVN